MQITAVQTSKHKSIIKSTAKTNRTHPLGHRLRQELMIVYNNEYKS